MRSSLAQRPARNLLDVLARAPGRMGNRRALARALVRKYAENDLLTYASAISFQAFFALIPLLLFAFGVLGFLDLGQVWRNDLAPEVHSRVSAPAFQLIDHTLTEVLQHRQWFWATIGAAIAVWEVSGAMRAVTQVFNRVYGVEETRPFWERMRLSIWLGGATSVLVLAAVAVVRFGPLLQTLVLGDGALAQVASFVLRWSIALALLLSLVALLVRHAPNCARPLHWVSFGALLVVTSWMAMSLLFGWYVTSVADYSSLFGSLATLIVVLEYLYLSAIVFLTGVQLDALIHERVEGAHAARGGGVASTRPADAACATPRAV